MFDNETRMAMLRHRLDQAQLAVERYRARKDKLIREMFEVEIQSMEAQQELELMQKTIDALIAREYGGAK